MDKNVSVASTNNPNTPINNNILDMNKFENIVVNALDNTYGCEKHAEFSCNVCYSNIIFT